MPGIPVVLAALLLAACPRDEPVCLRGEPFVADGPIPIETEEAAARPGDPHRVVDLRWEAHEGCEQVVIALAAEDGRPAGAVGEVRAELLRDLGLVRVSLRDVSDVDPDATDAAFGGPLAGAAYAVWSPDGRWVYVDLHLAEAAEAHVAAIEHLGTVVVDLRPGGVPLPEPPATDRLVVVLEPRAGEASYPLTVTGYARTFEANVVARIEREGEEVEETFTTATAWVDAWGHYSLTFDEGPSGPIELHVGEYSARDGAWEGTVVRLDMR